MAKAPPAPTTEGLLTDLKSAAALLKAIEAATGHDPCADELLALADSPIALELLLKALTEGK